MLGTGQNQLEVTWDGQVPHQDGYRCPFNYQPHKPVDVFGFTQGVLHFKLRIDNQLENGNIRSNKISYFFFFEKRSSLHITQVTRRATKHYLYCC